MERDRMKEVIRAIIGKKRIAQTSYSMDIKVHTY